MLHTEREREVWFTPHSHLGDIWAFTSYILKQSEIENKTIYFDRGSLNSQISSFKNFFDTNGKIELNKQKNKIKKVKANYMFFREFLKTKIQWKENNNKIIAYQFDGRHLNYNKNPNKNEIIYFLNFFEKLGYNLINVGNFKPLSFIIKTLSECEFFIGVISGISIVANSVGCPINLLENNLPKWKVNKLKFTHLSKIKNINYYKRINNFTNKFILI